MPAATRRRLCPSYHRKPDNALSSLKNPRLSLRRGAQDETLQRRMAAIGHHHIRRLPDIFRHIGGRRAVIDDPRPRGRQPLQKRPGDGRFSPCRNAGLPTQPGKQLQRLPVAHGDLLVAADQRAVHIRIRYFFFKRIAFSSISKRQAYYTPSCPPAQAPRL